MTKEGTVTLERTYECTPEQLWRLWTDPDRLTAWFNPAPGIAAVIQALDVRVGGTLHVLHRGPEGSEYAKVATFTAVDEPARLRFKEPIGPTESTTTVTLAAQGRLTRLTLEQDRVPEPYRAPARAGWGAMLDKLGQQVQHLAVGAANVQKGGHA